MGKAVYIAEKDVYKRQPKERIAHPTRTLMIRTGIPEEALMYSLKHQVKKSMIGPPQNAQTMVPGLTYPLVVNNIRTIKIHRTMTCTVQMCIRDRTYHVRPEEILVITFTKYAAVEMKNRFFSAMKGTRPAVTLSLIHI